MRNYKDTILERKLSEYFEGVEYRLYESPYNLTRGVDRENWVHNQIPCFGEDIKRLYKAKELTLMDECLALPSYAEKEERRSFIKWPLVGAFDQKDTLGGIWVESIDNREGLIHIFSVKDARKKYKGFTSEMYLFFLENYKSQMDTVRIDWGARSSENDPSRFFERNNFEIVEGLFYNSAYYKIK